MNVVIDTREQRSPVRQLLLADPKAHVHERALRAGDYLVEHRFLVERKTAADLHESLRNGRLWDQAYRLRSDHSHIPLFVIEWRSPCSASAGASALELLRDHTCVDQIGERGVLDPIRGRPRRGPNLLNRPVPQHPHDLTTRAERRPTRATSERGGIDRDAVAPATTSALEKSLRQVASHHTFRGLELQPSGVATKHHALPANYELVLDT